MTRVHERHVSAVPSAADRHRRVDQKKKASYKVILEEVADKQKKLKTVLYPEQKAPRGYTFIPAGDPQLTNRCKKLAREDGFTVFIVSTSRHPRQGLSREIHRVGFHFPSVTVEKACDSLGVTLSNSGRVLQSNFAHLEDGQERDGKRSTKQKKQKAGNRNAQPALDISLPQAVIDTSARETIRDLFPNIPNQDLHVIVGRSFQKGKGLVGTVADLSLVRRAQLAVIAHIRHTYTDYDALLRQVQYNEARRRVEKPCLDRLIRWRGDDDDAGDMDDVLREVIVIPDDDEEEDDKGDSINASLRRRPEVIERDSSVEYISETDMQIQPIDYSNINRTAERGDSYTPESDREVQYLGRNQLHHGRQAQYDQQTLDRMGTHRQRVYEEALDRRRKHPENFNVHTDHSSLPVFASSGYDIHTPSQQPQDPNYQPHLIERGDQVQGRPPVQTRLMPIARPDDYTANHYSNTRDPRYVLEENVPYSSPQDQRIYKRGLEQPKSVYYTKEDQFHNNGTRSIEMRQLPERDFDQDERFVIENDIRRENGNNFYSHDFESPPRRRSEMVLPSIERDLHDEHIEPAPLQGNTRQLKPFGSYEPRNREMQQLPAPPIIQHGGHEGLPSSKRRKIDDQQPVNSLSQARTILVPVEQIDDRRTRYEQPYEAAYRDDTGHLVSDKRIVPLPPKEDRARSPISHQELQSNSSKQIRSRPDQVADRVERDPHPHPHDHYQIPLSRSKNVGDLQFPSRAPFAPTEYSNDSPSFKSSQFAPRHLESSDLGFQSRHSFGVNANSDRVYADSSDMTRRLQPMELAERSMPSRFSDMSIDYRQNEDDRRPDRVSYLPIAAKAEFYSQRGPSKVKPIFHEDIELPRKAIPHDTSGSRMKQSFGIQEQPVWPVNQNASSYHQINHQYTETDRANAVDRRAPPPALRAAMEPWDVNIEPRNRPLIGGAEGRQPHIGVSAARPQNTRPFRREYENFRLGMRKGPDDIVVLD